MEKIENLKKLVKCIKCLESNPTWQYAKWGSSRDPWCTPCKQKYPKEWILVTNYRSRNLRVYGIDPKIYNWLLSQHNGCWICGYDNNLVIDHCHDTGKVRGILCNRCNTGSFGDNIELLEKKIEYLKKGPLDLPEPEVGVQESDIDHPMYGRWVHARQKERRSTGSNSLQWSTFEGFLVWLYDNHYPECTTVVKIDRNAPFTPDNCTCGTLNDVDNSEKYTKFEIDGELKTVREIASINNISTNTVYRRLEAGESIEDAMSANRNFTYITIFGEEKSISAWAKDPRCQVGYHLFRSRLLNGMEPEKALIAHEGHSPRAGVITAFGESKGILQWAKDPRCLVGYSTLRYRIVDKNWDPEEAILTPSSRKQ